MDQEFGTPFREYADYGCLEVAGYRAAGGVAGVGVVFLRPSEREPALDYGSASYSSDMAADALALLSQSTEV